jgi:hypothetical protein
MNTNTGSADSASTTPKPLLAVFWLYVIVPLAWGVINTLIQATKLFH